MIIQTWHNHSWALKSSQVNPFQQTMLIPFYNKLSELRLVLASCETQTLQNFEILICDDGSKPEIVAEVQKEFLTSPLPIQYVWHADLGFRKNRIMNHGIILAKADYLVFIDGDVVLHPEFMREHYQLKEEKTVLSGRQPELSEAVTKELTPQRIREGYIEQNLFAILLRILPYKDSNGIKGLYFQNEFLRQYYNKKPRPLLGRNFSLFKKDILAVNGFNMTYEGVGIGEDSDIDYRLTKSGVKTKPVINICVQYHLYHKTKPRENNNHLIFAEVVKKNEVVTQYGIQELKRELDINKEYAAKP